MCKNLLTEIHEQINVMISPKSNTAMAVIVSSRQVMMLRMFGSKV